MTNIEELDDPYLELFDRINQLELEVNELRETIYVLTTPAAKWRKDIPMPEQQEFKFFE